MAVRFLIIGTAENTTVADCQPGFDTVNVNICQAATAIESTIPDACDAIRDHYAC